MRKKLTNKGERDLKLINRAIETGDPKAYAELMKLYRDPLYFMIYEKISDQDVAKDLTIESLGKAFKKLQESSAYALELVDNAVTPINFIPILMGSNLPDYDGVNFKINGIRYTYNGQIINPSEVNVTLDLVFKLARRYLYAPYL